MIGAILGEVLGGVLDHFKERRALKKAKVEAQIALEVKKASADIEWDKVMAEGSQTSWKDEWWTILLSIPLILCFIPGASEYAAAGFQNLQDNVPHWYLMALGTAIAAAFGRSSLTKALGKR